MRLCADSRIAPTDSEGFDAPMELLSIEDVKRAVARLSAADRRVFQLAHVENLSYREMSARLAIPINTVGTQILRMRRKLRVILSDVCQLRAGQLGIPTPYLQEIRDRA